MIDNFNLLLLLGGRYLCRSEWSRDSSEVDNCFKFYVPVSGMARVRVDGKWHRLEPGNAYYISGFQLERNECEAELDVYWIHFVPQSLQMRYALNNSKSFHYWKIPDIPFPIDSFEIFSKLFKDPTSEMPIQLVENPDTETCRVQSILLYFLSDLIEQAVGRDQVKLNERFTRIQSSINFMNEKFAESPSLADIASKSAMAPNYFHRIFAQMFEITPLNYMIRRRLDLARQLLATTTMTIKEISWQIGYDCEFYFSRTFKKHIKLSPSQFRKRNWEA